MRFPQFCRKCRIFILLALYAWPGYAQTSNALEVIAFSAPGGIYDSVFNLAITTSYPAFHVRYTTDGTAPTPDSKICDGIIRLDRNCFSTAALFRIPASPPDLYYSPGPSIPYCIVIRACAFNDNGQAIGPVQTHSYCIREAGSDHGSLPVISLCSDHHGLFSDSAGILVPGIFWDPKNPDWTGNYYQRGDEWEREAHFEFFDPGNGGRISQDAGIRTHGGNSRRFPQKGLRLYARSEYGPSTFAYPFFPEKNLTEFKRLVLKPMTSSWSGSCLDDPICGRLAASLGLDYIASRPAVVYLNGEYWGLYYLQERADEHYIEANTGMDKDSIDLIGNWWGLVESGYSEDFMEMYNFAATYDLSDPFNFDSLCRMIDLENFIDYTLLEIFIGNHDWPSNNMKMWKSRTAGSKWRWIFIDGDAALFNPNYDGFHFALTEQTDDGPSDAQATMLLRKLMENKLFSDRFFERFQEIMENELNYETVRRHYSEAMTGIAGEMRDQIDRHAFPDSYSLWCEALRETDEFLASRACTLEAQAKERFGTDLRFQCLKPFTALEVFDVIPNPAKGDFTVRFNSPAPAAINLGIFSPTGQRLAWYDMVTYEGTNSFTFHGDEFPSGLLLGVVQANGRLSSFKILNIKD